MVGAEVVDAGLLGGLELLSLLGEFRLDGAELAALRCGGLLPGGLCPLKLGRAGLDGLMAPAPAESALVGS